jgi:6-phosphogluconolactonase (cycloisomerase 2 family)
MDQSSRPFLARLDIGAGTDASFAAKAAAAGIDLQSAQHHHRGRRPMLKTRPPASGARMFPLLVLAASVLLGALAGQTRPAARSGQPASARQGAAPGRSVVYSSIGPVLTIWALDTATATLAKRSTVTLPGFVTEATLHPSKKIIYIVWGRFQDGFQIHAQPHEHGMSAFNIDSATGNLTPHGPSVSLGKTPGYISAVTTDISGRYVLASDSDPSRISVHRLRADGTIGQEIVSPGTLDFGIHAHQIRIDPSNQTVVLPCRGDSVNGTELPGSLRLFAFKDGILTARQSIGPGNGFDFNARHMDFHPSGQWEYFTTERQNKLLVYERKHDGSLGQQLYSKDTLARPSTVSPGQIAGTVHVHPNGRFVYVANRASSTTVVNGARVWAGGENSLAVFSINPSTGEPTLIQHMDTRGLHPRTFALDPSSRVIVAANNLSLPTREGTDIPASLSTYRIGSDGKLEFVRKYDVDLNDSQQFWAGIVPLR